MSHSPTCVVVICSFRQVLIASAVGWCYDFVVGCVLVRTRFSFFVTVCPVSARDSSFVSRCVDRGFAAFLRVLCIRQL